MKKKVLFFLLVSLVMVFAIPVLATSSDFNQLFPMASGHTTLCTGERDGSYFNATVTYIDSDDPTVDKIHIWADWDSGSGWQTATSDLILSQGDSGQETYNVGGTDYRARGRVDWFNLVPIRVRGNCTF